MASKTNALAELGRDRLRRRLLERIPAPKPKSSDALNLKSLKGAMADWAKPLFLPSRYKCLFGGRGSGKSFAVADALLIEGVERKIRVLCAREFQNSIKDSVHHLLRERIEALGLSGYYWVKRDEIEGTNGTTFVFKGVRMNAQSIKSMSAVTHCWIEEAQTISAESWQILVPTIREEGSEIWVTFNPLYESDTVYQELVSRGRDRSYVRRVNWSENPWFPSVLEEERRAMQASDPDAYQHIWEGGFWEKSDAQILSGKWIVEEFESNPREWGGPYFGGDFGFAQDPTALVRCWLNGDRLYVDYESWAIALELDDMAGRWKQDVPGCDRHIVRADNSRPETISYLRRHGIDFCEPVRKWPGSLEDGIAYLRSLDKIVIHPRCKHLIEEARLYRYKTDKYTGDVLPVVVGQHDHCVDGLRYAVSPLIEARNTGWVGNV